MRMSVIEITIFLVFYTGARGGEFHAHSRITFLASVTFPGRLYDNHKRFIDFSSLQHLLITHIKVDGLKWKKSKLKIVISMIEYFFARIDSSMEF